MKISQKLILGFVGIALMVGVVGYISLNQLNKIAKPLSKDIPESIKALTDTSHLDSLAQFIRYYDEILTQSARNYTFTQDKKWEKRYRDVEPKLDKIIKEAIEIGDEEDKSFFSSVDKANLALVEMEYKSIEFVDNRQAEQAVKILESNEYWSQKKIYEKGLRDYVSRRGSKYDEALSASTKTIDLATRQAQILIKTSTQLILVFATAILILAVGIGLFISHFISGSIAKLTGVAAEIGKGELDTKIDIKSKDEIGQLARAFKQMTEDLKNITASRDELNEEIIRRKNMQEALKDTYQKLKETQEQLIQSDKMAAMGQLAAGISHELNQPLTGIKGFAQVALTDLDKKSPLKKDIERIVEQADRMAKIIQHVRLFARKSDFKPTELNINKPIEDSFILLTQQLKTHNIRINKSLGKNLPMIEGDSNQLEQVFINLITNARDAIDSLKSPDGGEITIQSALSKDKKHIEVIFKDTGCGVSKENLNSLFNPFFTTKSPDCGIGLGLSIVYRIIESHKGSIEVDSEESRGTIFKITLPVI